MRAIIKGLIVGVAALAVWFGSRHEAQPELAGAAPAASHALAPTAAPGPRFDQQASGSQIRGSGEVVRLLADDDDGSRHQRFILRLPWGQTLLVAHNIDLAERVRELRVGDRVEFSGEFQWNAQGGVLHWTHRDPAGRQPGGWLRHAGREYR